MATDTLQQPPAPRLGDEDGYGYRMLVLGVVFQAVQEAKKGDEDAMEFLQSGEASDWLAAVGYAGYDLDPVIRRARVEYRKARRFYRTQPVLPGFDFVNP